MDKNLDKLLSDRKNFYFLKRVIDGLYYIFFLITQPRDAFEVILYSNFYMGIYIETEDGKNIIFINLKSPLIEAKGNEYDIKKLVETELHELLHYACKNYADNFQEKCNEETIRKVTREILKGYRYSKIPIK